MTTSSSTNKVRYEGNGVTDTFAFNGRIFSEDDLVVEIILRADDSLVDTLTLTTDYTVSITGPETASVVVDTPPTNLQDIQIRRSLSLTQTLDLPIGTVFPAEKVENALDKAMASIQDLEEELSRKIGIPVTSSEETPDLIDLIEEATEGAEIFAQQAEAARDAALAAQSLAEDAQDAAEVHETNAEAAATDAATYQTNIISSVAAVAQSFIFDNSTTMVNPGVGEVRFNNSNVTLVTQIAISNTSSLSGNPDISDYIVTWDNSTNDVKGHIIFKKATDTIRFVIYEISGTITDNTSWLQIPVTYVEHNSSFTAADPIWLQFSRAGDKGIDGADGGGDTLPAVASGDRRKSVVVNQAENAYTTVRFLARRGSSVTAAATVNIGRTSSDFVYLTGSATPITSFDSDDTNAVRDHVWVRVITAQATFVHSSLIIMPLAQDYVAEIGDVLEFVRESGANWICLNIFRQDGASITSVEGAPYTHQYGGAQIAGETALSSSSASIAIDMALSNDFTHTFTEDTTLANPTNAAVGQSGAIRLTQHASSPKTLAYGTSYKFPGGIVPSVSATNSAADTLFYYVRSSSFIECNLVKGFA